jgi:hypothetical protein
MPKTKESGYTRHERVQRNGGDIVYHPVFPGGNNGANEGNRRSRVALGDAEINRIVAEDVEQQRIRDRQHTDKSNN